MHCTLESGHQGTIDDFLANCRELAVVMIDRTSERLANGAQRISFTTSKECLPAVREAAERTKDFAFVSTLNVHFVIDGEPFAARAVRQPANWRSTTTETTTTTTTETEGAAK